MSENQRTYAEHLINRIINFGIQSKLNESSDVVLNAINYPQEFQTVSTSVNYPNPLQNLVNAYTNFVQSPGRSSTPVFEIYKAGNIEVPKFGQDV